jgi:hypothetical protein
MKKHLSGNSWVVAGALLMGFSLSAMADALLYDDSETQVNGGTRFSPQIGGTEYEVGNQVTLGVSGAIGPYITQFSFEYYAVGGAGQAFSGAPTVDVRFYLNDGPTYQGYATPGTLLWDSGTFGGITPTPRDTLTYSVADDDFPSGGVLVPNSFTWTVTFAGLGSGDDLGLDLYAPPAVGHVLTSYWINDGWQLLVDNSGTPIDFGSQFFGIVPEPGQVAGMAVVGAILGAAGFRAWRRKGIGCGVAKA